MYLKTPSESFLKKLSYIFLQFFLKNQTKNLVGSHSTTNKNHLIYNFYLPFFKKFYSPIFSLINFFNDVRKVIEFFLLCNFLIPCDVCWMIIIFNFYISIKFLNLQLMLFSVSFSLNYYCYYYIFLGTTSSNDVTNTLNTLFFSVYIHFT